MYNPAIEVPVGSVTAKTHPVQTACFGTLCTVSGVLIALHKGHDLGTALQMGATLGAGFAAVVTAIELAMTAE